MSVRDVTIEIPAGDPPRRAVCDIEADGIISAAVRAHRRGDLHES